jgi:hypothetical protein
LGRVWLGGVLLLVGLHWMSAGADGYALRLALLNPLVALVSLLIAQKSKRVETGSHWTFLRALSIAWLVAALANLVPLGPPRQLTGTLVGHSIRVTGGKTPNAANRISVQTDQGVFQAEMARVPGGLRLNHEVQVTLSRRLFGDKIVAIAPLP